MCNKTKIYYGFSKHQVLWKSPQTKTKNSYCNAPAEQGDSKMQQKLSSHTVVAAKYGTRCVALPKLEAKSQKYKLAAFFQGHNSSVETFQIRLSLGGSDRSSECSYTAPAHPPKPQPSDNVTSVELGSHSFLMKVVFVTTISQGGQAAETEAAPCLFLPQEYSQQYTQALSVKDRISILQTTQIQVGHSFLILPFSNLILNTQHSYSLNLWLILYTAQQKKNTMYSLSTWTPSLDKKISAKDATDKAILLETYIPSAFAETVEKSCCDWSHLPTFLA